MDHANESADFVMRVGYFEQLNEIKGDDICLHNCQQNVLPQTKWEVSKFYFSCWFAIVFSRKATAARF